MGGIAEMIEESTESISRELLIIIVRSDDISNSSIKINFMEDIFRNIKFYIFLPESGHVFIRGSSWISIMER